MAALCRVPIPYYWYDWIWERDVDYLVMHYVRLCDEQDAEDDAMDL